MLKKLAYLFASLVFLSGCASSHMTKVAPEQAVVKPEKGKALVHFMRPSSLGGAIQSTVYDDTKYIGTVSAYTRVPYQANAGKHLFMVVGESADFMEAELTEGKTYYVIVAPRIGLWKARFSLDSAIEMGDQTQVDKWFKETSEVTTNESGLAWANENKADILKKKEEYLPKWQQKAEGDKQRLKANSGM